MANEESYCRTSIGNKRLSVVSEYPRTELAPERVHP